MKLKNLWLIAVAILIYACNAEETRSWEVTFDPNKPKDPNEQSIINVAAGKFYKMNVVANNAYADKAPLDPWTSGTKLTDEETGTLSTKNRGVGWDAQTVEVIIDLGSLRSITEVSVHAISDPTLYQSGYLTIKEYDRDFRSDITNCIPCSNRSINQQGQKPMGKSSLTNYLFRQQRKVGCLGKNRL